MKLLYPNWKPYIHLFLITLSSCVLINSGSLNSIDALNRLQVTHWIWTNSPQVIVSNPGAAGMSAIGQGGHRYVTWGIGQSLIMLPADVIATTIIKMAHLQRMAQTVDPGLVSYLTFPLLNATSICLACGILRELNFSVRESILGALALLFCTTFLVYSQIQQENSLMIFCLLGGLWGNIRWLSTGRFRYLIGGMIALGLGLLIRLPSIFDAAAIFLFVSMRFLAMSDFKRGRVDTVRKLSIYTAMFVSLYVPFVILDRVYQWIRFGSFTNTYTSIWGYQMRAAFHFLPTSFPFSTPFFQGFLGQLFSPDRSIFLFNPLLILLTILLIRLWNRIDLQLKIFLATALLLLIADIALYSKWFLWGGAGSWGPRYAVVPSEYMALLAVPIFLKLRRHLKWKIEKLICVCLIIASGFIQLLSILFDYNLELSQEAALHATYLVVWQRIVNTWHIAMGSFQGSDLAPYVSSDELRKWTRLAFMPWRTEGQLPNHVTEVLQTAWLVFFLLLFVYVTVFSLRTLRSSSFEE